ncbi:glycoside hydrolase family 43 protein [Spirosoma pollinicola]|uniref:Glycoside hydrolase n=1 Tax=Spirosoma pollinicola TaxID=2057025 RepID=A0A2K8YYG7_9BACT|nr:glycoside hydrolase family 43 protein [Spirosoma pollinicola]AUD02629.1 glycoside hydrolase [Spirosoma pollinicola]
MTRISLAAFFLVVSIIRCVAQTTPPLATTGTYQNPVISGDFADPSIIRVGDTYYAVGTSSEWGPAFPIYTSKDLVNWAYVGPVFTKLPAWTMGSFWAPELVYRKGTFYVYYTARRKSDGHSYIGVATTQDLRKGFTDHGVLIEWTAEAIDAFVIEDEGHLYITWKAYGLDKGKDIEILGAELSADGLRVIGKAFSLLKADRDGWEAGGAEGQAIVKHGRYFYMTYSGNTCCGAQCNYQVGLARAEKLQGPWEKFSGNPVLVSSVAWKCPGHGTVVTTPNNRYFYLHHAYNGTDFTFTGRQGVLSELVWNDNTQWPAFRYGTTTPAQAESPAGVSQKRNLNLSVNFAKDKTPVPWVWDVSQPKPGFTVQQGQLQLANTASSVAGSFLGLVVKKGTYTFSAEVNPVVNLQQSVCVYGDANNAIGFGIQKDSLQLWQVKDGVRTVLKTQSLPGNQSSLKLLIHSKLGQFYTFGWQLKGGPPILLSDAPLNGSFLPRWDRAPRVGISVSGQPKAISHVQSISMDIEEDSH